MTYMKKFFVLPIGRLVAIASIFFLSTVPATAQQATPVVGTTSSMPETRADGASAEFIVTQHPEKGSSVAYTEYLQSSLEVRNTGNEPLTNVVISFDRSQNQLFELVCYLDENPIDVGGSVWCSFTTFVYGSDAVHGSVDVTIHLETDQLGRESTSFSWPVVTQLGAYDVFLIDEHGSQESIPVGTKVCYEPLDSRKVPTCRTWEGTTLTFDEELSMTSKIYSGVGRIFVEPPAGSGFESPLLNVYPTQGETHDVAISLIPTSSNTAFVRGSVDKPEVDSGEQVTLTLTAGVRNRYPFANVQIPPEFEYQSMECSGTVEIPEWGCEPNSGLFGPGTQNLLEVMGNDPVMGEMSEITVQITGVVTGEPGDVIRFYACTEPYSRQNGFVCTFVTLQIRAPEVPIEPEISPSTPVVPPPSTPVVPPPSTPVVPPTEPELPSTEPSTPPAESAPPSTEPGIQPSTPDPVVPAPTEPTIPDPTSPSADSVDSSPTPTNMIGTIVPPSQSQSGTPEVAATITPPVATGLPKTGQVGESVSASVWIAAIAASSLGLGGLALSRARHDS